MKDFEVTDVSLQRRTKHLNSVCWTTFRKGGERRISLS